MLHIYPKNMDHLPTNLAAHVNLYVDGPRRRLLDEYRLRTAYKYFSDHIAFEMLIFYIEFGEIDHKNWLQGYNIGTKQFNGLDRKISNYVVLIARRFEHGLMDCNPWYVSSIDRLLMLDHVGPQHFMINNFIENMVNLPQPFTPSNWLLLPEDDDV